MSQYRRTKHGQGTSPWDVSIDTTKAGLERLGRALIETSSRLTDSFVLGSHKLGRGVSAHLRVFIPEGHEQEFDRIAKPIERRPPPKLVLNCG